MTRLIPLLALVALAGCTMGEDNTVSPATPTAGTAAATTSTTLPASRDPVEIRVTLAGYEILPDATSVAAGAYQLTVTNRDRVPHGVVLLQTELGLEQLPTEGIRVDELDDRLDIRARTATIAGGGAGSLVATLRPGTYVLVCTVPHHYVRDRMAVTLTVS